ncbi:MAG TPA: ISKra4 family transposase [Candidatus Binatia bacterium]
MEATEMAVREAMHQAGTKVLTGLLRDESPVNRTIACSCGETANYLEMRPKTILTAVGWVEMLRAYYLCDGCHVGQAPMDRELDVEKTDFSPGVRRMMALAGHHSPFDFGRREMEALAGLVVTTKAVERIAEAIGADIARQQEHQIREIMRLEPAVETSCGEEIPVMYIEIDATGIPIVPWELDLSKPGRLADAPRTREAKLGCIFTQTCNDAEGGPMRDTSSTTYVAAIETSEQFGARIYAEARRRGLDRAKRVVVIADGAPWIWMLARTHFPGAIEILDLYHAREHLWKLAAKLFPSDEVARRRWAKRFQQKLDNGKIKRLVGDLRSISTPNDELRKTIETEADYYDKNKHRMRYPEFRRQGLFVGSGVVEAGCKTVIGSRFKMSGMLWTVRGANSIIALRCNLLNDDFEDYWHQRRA